MKIEVKNQEVNKEVKPKQNFTRSEVDEIVSKVKNDKEQKYRKTICILGGIMTLLGIIAILAILL